MSCCIIFDSSERQGGLEMRSTTNLRIKISGFQRVLFKRDLDIKGWNLFLQ